MPNSTQETKVPLKDWEILWENAKANLANDSNTLDKNEKKYDSVIFTAYIDENGEVKETAIVGQYYFDDDGNYFSRMNELGYDLLPPDIQDAFGERDEVVGKWIKWTEEQRTLHDTFIYYTRNDEGYDTWEEYRDAKLGKQEDISISPAQDVEEIETPNNTPSVEGDERLNITK
ncbi:hypothetical protein [Aquimarina algiphila]|uniref:Uncharacterized protein n=1 Tax=Aquimarina algiphila TaxID=2047982 RepID=A0A554VID8_9FLAO|nr:hypothetical protein [Aquimarina algiphila]TSE07418.1 hypothetical protein FOF46_16000 [Aquimarina algiphila]